MDEVYLEDVSMPRLNVNRESSRPLASALIHVSVTSCHIMQVVRYSYQLFVKTLSQDSVVIVGILEVCTVTSQAAYIKSVVAMQQSML
jgi:hypothetical protein